MLKRVLSLILCVSVLIAAELPVFAEMITDSCVQLIRIKTGKTFDTQSVFYYNSFKEAFQSAESGDVIELFGDITVSSPITVPSGINLTVVSGTKRVNTSIYGRSAFEYTDQNATKRAVRKNFSGSLFNIGENSDVTFENIVLDGNGKGGIKGGLIYAENGAVVTVKRGVTLKGSVLGENSFGGAVYVEKDASLKAEDTVFSGNRATVGSDIYAERKTDVTIADGITADFFYPEETGVAISGLNLILTGEIGLTFHTFVPQEYEDGTFVMTSRTGNDVTCKIADCQKDTLGRYMAKYNLSSVELSEPVVLTVYDKEGNPLATKEKSVEDYGKWLLENSATAESEKNVIKALLNYGHYAQIECAENNGWEIGKDYKETQKYATLIVRETDYKGYDYIRVGYDPEIKGVGVQLDMGYKTDMIFHIAAENKPEVLVNGEASEAEKSQVNNYDYCVRIEDIGALDLAKQFKVKINGNITLTFSVLSYCKSAISECSTSCRNATAALYEFYRATEKYMEGKI